MGITKLDRDLDHLTTMSREELVERWQAAYGCLPPAGARRELLAYSAGWHIQVKRLGGFSGDTKRLLRREIERIKRDAVPVGSTAIGLERKDGQEGLSPAGTVGSGTAATAAELPLIERRRLAPGARLLRDWNGQTHAVDVTVEGYLFDGTTYRSLSAIARRITGTHWSGPRFFGL